jgi:hypothetical protein
MSEAKNFKIDSFVFDMEGPNVLSGTIETQSAVSVSFRTELNADERQALHELLERVVTRVRESIKGEL